jgi:AbrB family looped-hinge helix DNA binding protein
MKTTIDKAGRIVVPQPLREKAGFLPGTELLIQLDERGIHLSRAVAGPKLVREGGRLLARPTAPTKELPTVDIAAWVDDERERWP